MSRQRLIRDALGVLLSLQPGISVLGEAVDAGEPKPHVILVDMPVAEGDGIDLLASVQRKSPSAKLLVLMDTSDETRLVHALRAGANGCVSRRSGGPELGRAIRSVHEGEVWAKRHILVRCLRDGTSGPGRPSERRAGRGALTTREREILRLLASGAPNKEIARTLVISEKTVKSHLGSVFRKLQVSGRVQAVLYALREGVA